MKINIKDFFLELSVVVVMYFLLLNMVFAVFTLIDMIIFDGERILFFYLDGDFFKFNIASLIVLTPAFWFLHKLLKKEFKINPEKKNFWLRKWSLALTGFISASIFIVTLINLVYRYLSAADFTINFLLKSTFTLILFSLLLYYFSVEFKDAWRSLALKKILENLFLTLLFVVTLSSLIALGNPKRIESLKQDLEKVHDLQSLESHIGYYYINKKSLPQNLSELEKISMAINGFKDLVGDSDYKYKKINDKEFELCTEFYNDFPVLPKREVIVHLSWKLDELRRIEDMWKFKKGETCFKFNVDELSLKDGFYPKPVPIY